MHMRIGKSGVHISALRLEIQAEGFRNLPQSLQVNAMIIP
jgi:hypothetical protein